MNLIRVTVQQSRPIRITMEKTGPPGPAADKHYEQTFAPLTEVVVNHNLNKRPAVTIFNDYGDEVEADVHHNSANQLVLNFSAAVSGMVVCN